jgi:hypothetical protein
MLIHLLNPDHGFAMFRPPEQGPPRMSASAKEFSLVDLCDPAGQWLPVGSSRLKSETIVTLRDHVGRYLVPHGDQVRLEFATAATAKFLLRKVNGKPGDDIRHGDAVGLGAFTSTPARYRWLQLDTHLKLGGITKTYGGSTQRPRLLEVNDLQVFGGVGLSDAWPTTAPDVQAGSLNLQITNHEGVWKDSHYDVSVTRTDGARYALGNRSLHALQGGGETVEVRVREGQRLQSTPVRFDGLPEFHPCELFARGSDGPALLDCTVTYRPLAPWSSSNRNGTQPKSGTVRLVSMFDFMTLQAGSVVLNGNLTFGVSRAVAAGAFPQFSPFTLTVMNGSVPLGAGGPGGWFCTLSVEPFPMPGFDTAASTPLPPVAPTDPQLLVGPNGTFSHSFEFLQMTPLSGNHLFCCTVTIIGTGADPQRFRRRFGLRTLPT